MKRPGVVGLGVVAASAAVFALASPMATCQGPGLKEAAEGSGVRLGVALSWHGLTEVDGYDAVVVRDFHAVTIENATKWGTVHHDPGGEADYSRADALVRFARRHGLTVRGHPLAWDEHVPHWMPPGVEAARYQRHHAAFLDGLLDRYDGEITTWDVINEAIEDDGSWSDAAWFAKLGDGWPDRLFRTARAADPDATLVYNDYSIEWDNARQAGVLRELAGWRARGVPIDAVGIQGHLVGGLAPSRAQWRQAIQRFAKLGVGVHLTELDVRTAHLRGGQQGRRIVAAAALYDAVAACVDEPACTEATIWGVSSGQSWLAGRGTGEEPVLYDAELERLPAWYAVQAALLRQPWAGCSESVAPAWTATAGALTRTEGGGVRLTDRPGDWAGPQLRLGDRVAEGLPWRVTVPVRASADTTVKLTLRVTAGREERYVPLVQGAAAQGAFTPLTATLDLGSVKPRLPDTVDTIDVYVEGAPASVDLEVRAAEVVPVCGSAG